jgi:glycosyltransferase involved in cell wall biosynthesis
MPLTDPSPANSDEAYVPLVTIVTVVFNGQRDVARTIESVAAQDYERLEYIVIDGKSTDGTLDIIQRYQQSIKTILSEPDSGVYDAMNKGIRLASGEFILFMNSGDMFASESALSSAMAQIQSGPEQVVFGTWRRHLDSTNSWLCRPELERGLFNHQAVIYSRSIHAWHGDYLSLRGLTTADYLFFVTLIANRGVLCKVIDTTLALIDVTGMSAGLQTFSQKYAIDYLCGRTSRTRLVAALALHPLFYRLKLLVRRKS